MIRTLKYLIALFAGWSLMPVFAAEQVGRLFMTPVERAGLEKIRQGGPEPVVKEPEEVKPVVPLVEGEEIIVLDGFVRRYGSKKMTTWINAIPQHENEMSQGIAVLPPTSRATALSLKLPSGKYVRLKAGQEVDAATGRVYEGYESGRTRAVGMDAVQQH